MRNVDLIIKALSLLRTQGKAAASLGSRRPYTDPELKQCKMLGSSVGQVSPLLHEMCEGSCNLNFRT